MFWRHELVKSDFTQQIVCLQYPALFTSITFRMKPLKSTLTELYRSEACNTLLPIFLGEAIVNQVLRSWHLICRQHSPNKRSDSVPDCYFKNGFHFIQLCLRSVQIYLEGIRTVLERSIMKRSDCISLYCSPLDGRKIERLIWANRAPTVTWCLTLETRLHSISTVLT